MKIATFKVTGMNNDGCASVIARSIEAMGGVRSAEVPMETEEATVKYDELLTSPNKIKLAVTSAGFGVESDSTEIQIGNCLVMGAVIVTENYGNVKGSNLCPGWECFSIRHDSR